MEDGIEGARSELLRKLSIPFGRGKKTTAGPGLFFSSLVLYLLFSLQHFMYLSPEPVNLFNYYKQKYFLIIFKNTDPTSLETACLHFKDLFTAS